MVTYQFHTLPTLEGMNMDFIKLLATGLITSFILDMLWLGVIAKKLYENNIGSLLRKTNGVLSPHWPSALIVYATIILGLIFFVVPKAQGNALSGLIWGMVFGAITYSIYDFTNLAILANWSAKISFIDVAWGAILCGVTSFVMVKVQG
jgi:uncharacterized membrane protein